MGRVTRRSVASKEESTPKESPKSTGRRGAKKDKPAAEDNSEGDSQETPSRSRRQAAKDEQKVDTPAKGRSAARGRSTSRGGARGKKEKEEDEESIEPEAGDEEEVEEKKSQRGSTRSRGKGKAGQEVKATAKGGRGAKSTEVDGDDEGDDESAKEKDTENNGTAKSVGGRGRGRTPAATPASRGERRSRSRATAEQENDKTDETADGDDLEQPAENEADATPKGRQRRAANKEVETSEATPTTGGRRARAQKPTPKPSPASSGRSSRRSGGAETAEDKISGNGDEITEQRETEKEADQPVTSEDKQESSKAAEVKDESTAEKESEKAELPPVTEKTADKKTELPSAAEKTADKAELPPVAEKTGDKKTELPSAAEKAEEKNEESLSTDKAEGEKEETSEETAMEVEESSTDEKAAATNEEPSTSEMVVEESSGPTGVSKKRKLEDDGDDDPSEAVGPSKKHKLEDEGCQKDVVELAGIGKSEVSQEMSDVSRDDVVRDCSEVAASSPSKGVKEPSQPIPSENTKLDDQTEQPAAVAVIVTPADAEPEQQTEATVVAETDSGPPSDVTGMSSTEQDVNGTTASDPVSEDNSSKLVKEASAPSPNDVNLQQNPVPTSEVNSPDTDNIPSAATTQSQVPPTVDLNTEVNHSAQSVPEDMEVQSETPTVTNSSNDIADHKTPAPCQNGTDEKSVNCDSHLAPSPDSKSCPTAPKKAYVPSSTAIDCRKFIINQAFPIEMTDPAYCFSVVSYNILADCHLSRADYSYTQPQYLLQDYRHGLLLKELEYLDGDIVCLQEVGVTYYNQTLLPAMKSRGYEGHFSKRTKESYEEGEATFVRTSKLDVISHESVSLTDLAVKEVDKSSLPEAVSSAAKRYLDRADVILLTELKCKKTGKLLTVCNVHVFHDKTAADVQCIQVACAIKQLVAKAGSDLQPHIICGDFNSDVTSPVYQLTRDGYLSDDHIRRLQALEALDNKDGSSHALIHHLWGAFQHTSSNLKNSYELALGKEPPVTCFTKTMKSFDHIFFSSTSIDNVGVLETLDLEVLTASGGLPSKCIPSDHLSVKAVFRLK